MRRYSGGDGTALLPQQQTTSSYSGRSGGPGYDIPCKQLRHIAVAAVAPAMISRVLRRSTVVVIVIVRNRLYDGTAAKTVQHCRRSSSQPHAPSLALPGTRGTTAATVQRRRSSQPHAPSLALSGTRGTQAATVQRRSSSQAPAPSVALAGRRGALTAMDCR